MLNVIIILTAVFPLIYLNAAQELPEKWLDPRLMVRLLKNPMTRPYVVRYAENQGLTESELKFMIEAALSDLDYSAEAKSPENTEPQTREAVVNVVNTENELQKKFHNTLANIRRNAAQSLSKYSPETGFLPPDSFDPETNDFPEFFHLGPVDEKKQEADNEQSSKIEQQFTQKEPFLTRNSQLMENQLVLDFFKDLQATGERQNSQSKQNLGQPIRINMQADITEKATVSVSSTTTPKPVSSSGAWVNPIDLERDRLLRQFHSHVGHSDISNSDSRQRPRTAGTPSSFWHPFNSAITTTIAPKIARRSAQVTFAPTVSAKPSPSWIPFRSAPHPPRRAYSLALSSQSATKNNLTEKVVEPPSNQLYLEEIQSRLNRLLPMLKSDSAQRGTAGRSEKFRTKTLEETGVSENNSDTEIRTPVESAVQFGTPKPIQNAPSVNLPNSFWTRKPFPTEPTTKRPDSLRARMPFLIGGSTTVRPLNLLTRVDSSQKTVTQTPKLVVPSSRFKPVNSDFNTHVSGQNTEYAEMLPVSIREFKSGVNLRTSDQDTDYVDMIPVSSREMLPVSIRELKSGVRELESEEKSIIPTIRLPASVQLPAVLPITVEEQEILKAENAEIRAQIPMLASDQIPDSVPGLTLADSIALKIANSVSQDVNSRNLFEERNSRQYQGSNIDWLVPYYSH